MPKSAHNTTMSLKQWALLLFLSLLWGASFLFAKIAVMEVPPFTLVLCRVAIAACALHLVLMLTRRTFFRPAPPWRDYFGGWRRLAGVLIYANEHNAL